MTKAQTLGEFIMDRQAEFPFVSGQLTRLLTDIGVAAKIVNQQVNRAGLTSILGAAGGTNVQDEQQQKLDVFADDTFMRILASGKSVCGIGSEERESFVRWGDLLPSHSAMCTPCFYSSTALRLFLVENSFEQLIKK